MALQQQTRNQISFENEKFLVFSFPSLLPFTDEQGVSEVRSYLFSSKVSSFIEINIREYQQFRERNNIHKWREK